MCKFSETSKCTDWFVPVGTAMAMDMVKVMSYNSFDSSFTLIVILPSPGPCFELFEFSDCDVALGTWDVDDVTA